MHFLSCILLHLGSLLLYTECLHTHATITRTFHINTRHIHMHVSHINTHTSFPAGSVETTQMLKGMVDLAVTVGVLFYIKMS